jgi:hypothetical protein
MPRDIDPTLLAALASPECWPIDLVQLTFNSSTRYIWTGSGPLVWNGNTFLGIGSLGSLGDITEGVEVRADGTSVELSGIDPVYLASALTDIRLGAPAYRWMGAVQAGTQTLIGTPYLLFAGQVDKPTINAGPDEITISLALETRMIRHAIPSNRRFTANDQHANGYPDDTGFNSVEIINDLALLWG